MILTGIFMVKERVVFGCFAKPDGMGKKCIQSQQREISINRTASTDTETKTKRKKIHIFMCFDLYEWT